MENLFYSKQEKTLFWIAGYTDNSLNVDEIIKMLSIESKRFNEFAKVDSSEIKTDYITNSHRYKSMRVFYCKTDHIPEEAFVLGADVSNDNGHDWTMDKWISN